MVAVDGVAASGEIVILPLRIQHIVNVVVEALEIDEGPVLISLCRMIEYNIKDNLYPRLMQIPDQISQFTSLTVVFFSRGIT